MNLYSALASSASLFRGTHLHRRLTNGLSVQHKFKRFTFRRWCNSWYALDDALHLMFVYRRRYGLGLIDNCSHTDWCGGIECSLADVWYADGRPVHGVRVCVRVMCDGRGCTRGYLFTGASKQSWSFIVHWQPYRVCSTAYPSPKAQQNVDVHRRFTCSRIVTSRWVIKMGRQTEQLPLFPQTADGHLALIDHSHNALQQLQRQN